MCVVAKTQGTLGNLSPRETCDKVDETWGMSKQLLLKGLIIQPHNQNHVYMHFTHDFSILFCLLWLVWPYFGHVDNHTMICGCDHALIKKLDLS